MWAWRVWGHFFLGDQEGYTRTRPCRDKPRLATRDAPGQDTGGAQGNLSSYPHGSGSQGEAPGNVETDRITTDDRPQHTSGPCGVKSGQEQCCSIAQSAGVWKCSEPRSRWHDVQHMVHGKTGRRAQGGLGCLAKVTKTGLVCFVQLHRTLSDFTNLLHGLVL
jgi:hypothetical protein